MIPTRERCAACQQTSPISFWVPNDMWMAVVHPHYQNSILCLSCFISRADEKLINWSEEIRLFPKSLASHLASVREIDVPDWRTDQPAQEGERLDPHTLERAAHEAEKAQIAGQTTSRFVEGRNQAAEDIAAAIRNLRGDQ